MPSIDGVSTMFNPQLVTFYVWQLTPEISIFGSLRQEDQNKTRDRSELVVNTAANLFNAWPALTRFS